MMWFPRCESRRTRIASRAIWGASGFLALALTACSTIDPAAEDSAGFAAPSQLTATLVDSTDIDLRWTNGTTEAAGYWVEFATPGDDFIMLDAVGPETSAFRHRRVARDTKFIYRIRPFFGRASDWARVTTRPAPAEGARALDVDGPLPSSSGAIKRVVSKESLRTRSTIAAAAPSALQATLASVTSVDLRWEDRADDEDGYLVEMSIDRDEAATICALLPPDTTSFRKARLPPATDCNFRVRAFFYGDPSQPVSFSVP